MRLRIATLVAAAAAAALVAACGTGDAGTGDVHGALVNHRDGAEVTFDGTLADEPAVSGGHERFHVTDPEGDRLEVDHNVGLATSVPAHRGDRVTIHGRLYIDPGGAGVHCTHAHTSKGCPDPGYIRFNGQTYS